MKVKLNEADIKVLKEIKKAEQAASFLGILVGFGLIADIYSKNVTELTINFVKADWDVYADGIGAIPTILAVSVSSIIALHMDDIDEGTPRYTFFEALLKHYQKFV